MRVSDTQAIFLVLFDDRESLDDISRNFAAPWFAEHVRPLLAGPVNRQVGKMVAGAHEVACERRIVMARLTIRIFRGGASEPNTTVTIPGGVPGRVAGLRVGVPERTEIGKAPFPPDPGRHRALGLS